MRRGTLAVLCGLVAFAGCESTAPKTSFDVAIAVTSDDGTPLSGVRVAGDEITLGTTGQDGVLLVAMRADDGTRMKVQPICPEGYDAASDGSLLVLRKFHGLEEGRGNELSLSLQCRPRERTAVLVVRSDGRADLPVLVDGVEVARTNAKGVAHLALRRPSNSIVRVALDTTGHPRLQPQNPETPFAIGEADDILVLDQSFELAAKTAKKHRRPKRRAETVKKPTGPVKIESTSKRRWRSL